jgi:serine protease Do
MVPIDGFGEVAERLRRSTVQIVQGGSGSGVIWDANGTIVTNAHVARADRARVELWDGRSFEGAVTSRDARRDLAIVKITAETLHAAVRGDSGALRPGELVMAVGNPMGFIGALTTGVVHATGPLSGLGRRNWVQAAVRLAPGNSGGPLATARGDVIGINTMVVSGGLALAIPSNTVADFVRNGASGVSLGVVVQPVQLERRRMGLLIIEVLPKGPADLASLLIGDVLTGANGQRFTSVDDLGDAMERSAGLLSLRFLRGDRSAEREVNVRLAALGAAA